MTENNNVDIRIDEIAKRLIATFDDLPSVAIAFSGGVDSAVVAAAAQKSFEQNVEPEAGRIVVPPVAVIADSPSLPREELENARKIADEIGIKLQIIRTDEIENPEYFVNDSNRCYHCKSELYQRMNALKLKLGFGAIVNGTNRDDLSDHRPGLISATEADVQSPLVTCGIRKPEVRRLARYWGISVAEKPASPCLSSRIAHGISVTPERLAQIEKAENILYGAGFQDCRARLHENDLLRIEVPKEQMELLLELHTRNQLVFEMDRLGFRYITFDLMGLRSGSLNQLVTLDR